MNKKMLIYGQVKAQKKQKMVSNANVEYINKFVKNIDNIVYI